MTRLLIIAALYLTSTAAALAQDDQCAALRYQRNSIYKAHGYCFKLPDQIRIFGNAGCQFDKQADVPLSQNDRDDIGRIVRMEHTMGCT